MVYHSFVVPGNIIEKKKNNLVGFQSNEANKVEKQMFNKRAKYFVTSDKNYEVDLGC